MARSTSRRVVRDQAGFTVLEAAVAMVVVAVGLLGLASVIPMMKADVVRSDQRTTAVFLAQETAEFLHSLTYTDSLLSAGTHDDDTFDVEGYTRTWIVEENVPMSGIKRVTVNIDRENSTTEDAQMVFLHSEAGR